MRGGAAACPHLPGGPFPDSMRILIVEDEPKTGAYLKQGLAEAGFVTDLAVNGTDGAHLGVHEDYDLVVLDVMLPGIDGWQVLKALRDAGRQMPVLFLTARDDVDDRVRGLEAGADDYLAKPFYVEELAARIQALVRRATGDRVNTLHVGNLVLDRIARKVSCRKQAIELTSREFALLEYMMRSPDAVFTRGQILEHVWGYDFDPTTNVVDVSIRRLRAKIASLEGPDAESPIVSVRGAGYRFRRAP